MVGRVLRPNDGKERALVLDHSGTVLRLGFHSDPLPLVLDDGNPKREAKPRERDEPLPKSCPKCTNIKPAKVHACPHCGFAPEKQANVEVEDGRLVKLERGKKRISKDDKQHVWSQLLSLAAKRGKSRGWASNRYREAFGFWPRGLRDVPAAPTDAVLNFVKSRAIAYANRQQKGGAA